MVHLFVTLKSLTFTSSCSQSRMVTKTHIHQISGNEVSVIVLSSECEMTDNHSFFLSTLFFEVHDCHLVFTPSDLTGIFINSGYHICRS
ncbi:hypothetical protein EV361DRAFT_616830 [Lentinula raphanica]|nr:hypothetical protein EV361DRAFT_616830 [Lentinula raphanica]